MANTGRFVRTVEERDDGGNVIETREVGAYPGALNRAHQEGLKSIITTVIQVPSVGNDMTAISRAKVITEKGTYVEYGDASPASVEPRFVPHLIRVSLTRAKARALGDATNISAVPIDELSKGDPHKNGNGNGRRHQNTGAPPRTGTRRSSSVHIDSQRPMTDSQRTLLDNLLLDKGYDTESAHEWLCTAFDVESLTQITKKQASGMIYHLQQEADLPQHPPES